MNNNPSPRRVILPKPGRSVDESTITRRPSWRGCPKIVAGFAPRWKVPLDGNGTQISPWSWQRSTDLSFQWWRWIFGPVMAYFQGRTLLVSGSVFSTYLFHWNLRWNLKITHVERENIIWVFILVCGGQLILKISLWFETSDRSESRDVLRNVFFLTNPWTTVVTTGLFFTGQCVESDLQHGKSREGVWFFLGRVDIHHPFDVFPQ